MKRQIVLVCAIAMSLACSLQSFLSPNQPPRTEIVFRSPRDMNLQPEDVPDLEEVPVGNPSTKPLLPEAIDQDQRTFVNIDLDITIESDVIMVPERTARSEQEIYELVVLPRRPGIQRSGKVERCDLGERCRLIYVIDKSCGSGWIVILTRNNVIVVLIGCGQGLERERLIRIGRSIDDRISAPPTMKEIVIATTAAVAIHTPSSSIETEHSDTLLPTTTNTPTWKETLSRNWLLTFEGIVDGDFDTMLWVSKIIEIPITCDSSFQICEGEGVFHWKVEHHRESPGKIPGDYFDMPFTVELIPWGEDRGRDSLYYLRVVPGYSVRPQIIFPTCSGCSPVPARENPSVNLFPGCKALITLRDGAELYCTFFNGLYDLYVRWVLHEVK